MFIELFILAFLVILAIYLVWVAAFLAGTFGLIAGRNRDLFSVSVIIPARNEEQTVAACVQSILRQRYPAELLEVVVVDDRSTDRTAAIVRELAGQHAHVKLVQVQDTAPVISGKKRALTQGIQAARGEIIFLIDADSQAGPDWIAAMLHLFEDQVGVVAGPALINPQAEIGLLHKVQSLEMTVLMAANAGHVGLSWPVVVSGSNLAYRRSVFNEVNGFAGIDHLASGDDDLLVQKVRARTAWHVEFCLHPDARVLTRPAPTLRDLFRQRIRWASKGGHYPDKWLTAMLWNTGLCYALSLTAWILALTDTPRFGWLLLPLLAKFILEFFLLVRASVLFDKRHLIKYFILLGVPHMPYVLLVGMLGTLKKFSWKK